MSTLDDAIRTHLAHAAASGSDPLTDMLCDQAAYATQPAALADTTPLAPRLREGWEREPIRVPHHWAFYGLCFLVGLLLVGCGGSFDKDEEPPPDERVKIPASPSCSVRPERCR